jgi:small multidrug resistance family-3 protein
VCAPAVICGGARIFSIERDDLVDDVLFLVRRGGCGGCRCAFLSISSMTGEEDDTAPARVLGAAGFPTQTMENTEEASSEPSFQWTALRVAQAVGIFILAGCAEIMGGWLVWKAVRDADRRPRWWMIPGSILLVIYGFLPTAQPTDSFGRIYAVYGGFFILMSFLAGWYLDGDQPDWGDIVGGSVALVGVLVVLFWPR